MRRKAPTKIRVMQIRIDQRSAVSEQAKADAEKCIVCKGTKFVSAGEGLIGTYNCNYCNGTGKRRLQDINLQLNA